MDVTVYQPDSVQFVRQPHEIDEFINSFQYLGARLFLRALKPSMQRWSDRVGRIVPPLEQLQALPVGTLGYEFAAFVRSRQLKPIAYGPRRAQLHDVLHALLGYDIDFVGEQQVQWFILGTKPLWFNIVIGGHFWLRSRQWQPGWDAFCRGRRSTLDPDTFPVEQLWHIPIAEIYQQYHLRSQSKSL
jgi:hypothetical protein